jgi:hypothetical protein
VANLLSRFNQTIVGSNSKLADYISKVSSKGDFKRITDLEVILNSWNNILLTPRRSYQFDPEYGSDLYKMIFEQAGINLSLYLRGQHASPIVPREESLPPLPTLSAEVFKGTEVSIKQHPGLKKGFM